MGHHFYGTEMNQTFWASERDSVPRPKRHPRVAMRGKALAVVTCSVPWILHWFIMIIIHLCTLYYIILHYIMIYYVYYYGIMYIIIMYCIYIDVHCTNCTTSCLPYGSKEDKAFGQTASVVSGGEWSRSISCTIKVVSIRQHRNSGFSHRQTANGFQVYPSLPGASFCFCIEHHWIVAGADATCTVLPVGTPKVGAKDAVHSSTAETM